MGAGAYLAGRRGAATAPPAFRQLTFQRGEIYSARFAPDGQTLLYAASWEGRPVEIFVSRLDSPEARPFGLKSADLLGVSPSGEMAISMGRRFAGAFQRTGTLARIGMTGGGTPREVQEDVQWADWSPDGRSFAVVRAVGPQMQLEYPAGKVLFHTTGWITNPRVSPDGRSVAFLHHPVQGDDGGSVDVVDSAGADHKLAADFSTEGGLAWFAGRQGGLVLRGGIGRQPGGLRRIARRPPAHPRARHRKPDAARRLARRQGAARPRLAALGNPRVRPGRPEKRDLSWLDWSSVRDMASDGSVFVFSESGEGGGPTTRRTRAASTARLRCG